MPYVAIFRSRWLPPSETFVRNQMSSLRRWIPVPVGLTAEASSISGDDAVIEWDATTAAEMKTRQASVGDFPHIRDALAQRHVALIHAHFGPDGIKILPTARALELPLVVTFHGYDASKLLTETSGAAQEYRSSLPELFSYASRIIAVSQFIARQLLAVGAPAEKIVTLPIGVHVPPTSALNTPRRGVLFIGRFVEKKGASDLLHAYAQLPYGIRRDHPLYLVGDGPLRPELEKLSDELAIATIFTGFIPARDVAQLIRSAACVVVPSRTAADGDSEGLPTTLLEAAAAYCPIVATDHAGTPEFVTDHLTGLLSPEHSPPELSANIRLAIINVPLIAQITREARKRVESDFNLETQTRKLEEEYDQILLTDNQASSNTFPAS